MFTQIVSNPSLREGIFIKVEVWLNGDSLDRRLPMKKVDISLMLALVTVAAPLALGQTTSSPSNSPGSQTSAPAASQSAIQSPNMEQAPAGSPGENPASAPQNPGTAANETNMAGQGPVTPQSAVTPTPAGPSVTTGVGVNDSATLQGQIQNAIQNEPTLKNDPVNIRVTDSTIELSGNTQTGKEKETAYRIASSFAENRRVKDRITVNGRGTAANSQSMNPQGTNRPASSSNPNNPHNPQNPNSQQNPSANNPAANGDASTNPR
jgi:hypothetical protein